MTATLTRRTARHQPGRPLKGPLAVPSGNPSSRATPENAAALSRRQPPPAAASCRQLPPHTLQLSENAQQRNLLPLFNFLQSEYSHPTPTQGLNRYAEVRGKPHTLSAQFIDDLLDVTGGGKARDFETARDHAIIRILRSEGIRREELLSMVVHGLPGDVIKNPVFRLVPLKSARAAGQGRLVSLAPASARALAAYLRARRRHKLAGSEWVWLGTRSRNRLGNTGRPGRGRGGRGAGRGCGMSRPATLGPPAGTGCWFHCRRRCSPGTGRSCRLCTA